MASTPDVSDPPDHPSSSVGSTMYSGSDGSDIHSRSPRGRSWSRESSPGPDPLIIVQGDDVNDYMKEQRLLAANRSANQGDAVSHPFPHDFSLNHGDSASNDGNGEDMTDEEFFAQFGEVGVPEWAKQPLDAAPQVQGDGDGDVLMDLNDEDIAAQLEAETPAEDDDLMILNVESLGAQPAAEPPAEDEDENLEAQLDAKIMAEEDDSMSEAVLQRQLNKELWAEARQERRQKRTQKKGKVYAPLKATFQGPMRIAPENEVLEISSDQGDDLTEPTEEELEAALEAELNGGDAAGGDPSNISGTLSVMSTLRSKIDPCTVKSYPKKQSKKRSKTQSKKRLKTHAKTNAPKSKSRTKKPARGKKQKPGPLGARVGRSKPPPMRRTDDLPVLYHRQDPINWTPLRKAITLSTRVDLNHCYKSLGLDVGRGKAVYEDLKAYLRIPGNSVDLSAKNVSNNDAKRIMARIAHTLLVNQGWGQKYFNRPSLASGCKYIPFDANSTEVFLEFTSLVYKAMKLEEKRKKGKAKQQEEKDANAVVQHQTSHEFAATTYHSPRAVAQPLPSPAPAPAPPAPVPTAPPRPRMQAFVNGTIVAPRSVAPCQLNGSIDPILARALGLIRAARN